MGKEHGPIKLLFFVIIFLSYIFFIVWITLLKRTPGTDRRIITDIFWSFKLWFKGSKRGRREVVQYIKNILLFIPYGLLFPSKDKGWRMIVITAIILSGVIEMFQYVFVLGWCELDDVISNAVGAIIGYGVFLTYIRVFGENHLWKEF